MRQGIRVHLVKLTPAETAALRVAMGDVQASVARFYADTARRADLDAAVRSFVANAQVVNDLLTNQAKNAADYKALFHQGTVPSPGSLEVINGVKYARIIAQHVLHIVRFSDDSAMVGGTFGVRKYAVWNAVDQTAHDRVTNRRKEQLKASYDSALRGREVVETMLEVLRFFQAVNPEIVLRDTQGEWVGFPLMSQPGVAAPLHPEEPLDVESAWQWLNDRPPNGDARVVCGQVTLDGTRYLCGFTFAGRHTFVPFAETIQQVERDLVAGAIYLEGDVWANVIDATSYFPQAQGAVFFSRDELGTWTVPVNELEREVDWCLRNDPETWLRVARVERVGDGLPVALAYGARRSRRLNACTPPSA